MASELAAAWFYEELFSQQGVPQDTINFFNNQLRQLLERQPQQQQLGPALLRAWLRQLQPQPGRLTRQHLQVLSAVRNVCSTGVLQLPGAVPASRLAPSDTLLAEVLCDVVVGELLAEYAAKAAAADCQAAARPTAGGEHGTAVDRAASSSAAHELTAAGQAGALAGKLLTLFGQVEEMMGPFALLDNQQQQALNKWKHSLRGLWGAQAPRQQGAAGQEGAQRLPAAGKGVSQPVVGAGKSSSSSAAAAAEKKERLQKPPPAAAAAAALRGPGKSSSLSSSSAAAEKKSGKGAPAAAAAAAAVKGKAIAGAADDALAEAAAAAAAAYAAAAAAAAKAAALPPADTPAAAGAPASAAAATKIEAEAEAEAPKNAPSPAAAAAAAAGVQQPPPDQSEVDHRVQQLMQQTDLLLLQGTEELTARLSQLHQLLEPRDWLQRLASAYPASAAKQQVQAYVERVNRDIGPTALQHAAAQCLQQDSRGPGATKVTAEAAAAPSAAASAAELLAGAERGSSEEDQQLLVGEPGSLPATQALLPTPQPLLPDTQVLLLTLSPEMFDSQRQQDLAADQQQQQQQQAVTEADSAAALLAEIQRRRRVLRTLPVVEVVSKGTSSTQRGSPGLAAVPAKGLMRVLRNLAATAEGAGASLLSAADPDGDPGDEGGEEDTDSDGELGAAAGLAQLAASQPLQRLRHRASHPRGTAQVGGPWQDVLGDASGRLNTSSEEGGGAPGAAAGGRTTRAIRSGTVQRAAAGSGGRGRLTGPGSDGKRGRTVAWDTDDDEQVPQGRAAAGKRPRGVAAGVNAAAAARRGSGSHRPPAAGGASTPATTPARTAAADTSRLAAAGGANRASRSPAAAVAAGSPAEGGGGGGSTRRQNKRWSADETDTFVQLVQQEGKGNWARILERGGDVLLGRTQVDLKDKWRNLIKYSYVDEEGNKLRDP